MSDQPERGTADTASFKNALRYVLRQDPDVVLIGEMRDLETIEAALTVSETGHLTLATLHTNSAVQTMNRIIDVFPPHQQEQIRVQLSFVLEGILAQQLIPKKSGQGRVLAVELMIPNPAIRNLIREDKIHQIYSMMQTGQAKFGMQTMNQSLFDLYSKGLISYEDAIGRSSVPEELITVIQRKGIPADSGKREGDKKWLVFQWSGKTQKGYHRIRRNNSNNKGRRYCDPQEKKYYATLITEKPKKVS